ncbi:MAG: ABC transporter permease [Planctomycetes bacterium]|nr:ABC transporter permease [Planctomycetota bacterium]MCD7897534.1 ABC transporter permease [Planctomycetaceae bacterium]
MGSFIAVYWREMVLLRRRLKRILAGMAVSPLLYMLTFGLALGGSIRVDGHRYIDFLLPGLIAMASMTQAFAIAGEINISRFYSRIFEEIQSSPASRAAYVLGEVCSGLTRVLLAVAVIGGIGLAFGVRIQAGIGLWLAVGLNGFVFSALAVALAMIITSHADQALLSNFVITPMAFLGGTFFPLDSLPEWAGAVLQILPLSHASQAIRQSAFGQDVSPVHYCILAVAGAAAFALAWWSVGRAKD